MKKEHKLFDDSWRIILELISGSNAYGLNRPDSDIDYSGVVLPPIEYYLSPFKEFNQFISKDPDRTIFSFNKFIKLASDNNPNIVELLWIDEKFIKKITPEGKYLRDHRDIFLSAKMKFTYSGYAYTQLKRLKNHKYWLMNPIKTKPKRSDFGLDNNSAPLSADEFGYMNSMMDDKRHKFSKEIIAIFNKEKEYRKKLKEYQNYQQWKNNRNPKRAKLEKEYGIDLKHCTNLVRLMVQAKHILLNGELKTYVGDIQEIKDVRDGKWSYDYLIEWAKDMENELDKIYKKKKYVIPHKPNIKKIEKLSLEILSNYYKIKI